MTDLVKRLRDKTRLRRAHGLTGWVLAEEALCDEAADEIERLHKLMDGVEKRMLHQRNECYNMRERKEKP